MILLLGLLHAIFVMIFFFFHRYIEMGVVIAIFIAFCIKILPVSSESLEKTTVIPPTQIDSFKKSLYIGSTILFYTALAGISTGISKSFGAPVNMQLFCYSVFILTSVIYGIYLVMYPKNPTVFMLFRIHSLVAGIFITVIIQGALLFDLFQVPILLAVNLLLLFLGVVAVIILDPTIKLSSQRVAIYAFLGMYITLWMMVVSYFDLPLHISLLTSIIVMIPLYLFFPKLMSHMVIKTSLPTLQWHFSNCVLGLSWATFFYLFWALFWGDTALSTTITSLILILIVWFHVYISEDRNPLFFTGILAIITTLYVYTMFFIFPPSFGIISGAMFFFVGLLLLTARWFQNTTEERIMASMAVIFMCGIDGVLIFQGYGLFALSMVFFFQSFLWYGAYEIFQKNYAENTSLS